MNRKVTAYGFLYVAPPNIDFSQPCHSAKRWQRRCFTLYEDGELSYALDDNPETVPQVKMDMNLCVRVCEADAITGHSHSILVAFRNDNPNSGIATTCEDIETDATTTNHHVPICYVKADTTEEIRWWQSLLQKYAKRSIYRVSATPVRMLDNEQQQVLKEIADTEEAMETCGPTIIQVNDSLSRPASALSTQSNHEISASQLDPLPNIVTRVDLGTRLNSVDAHHGTPRSVKYRNKVNKEEPSRKLINDGITGTTLPEIPPPLPESPCPPLSSRKAPLSVPFSIDTSSAHTLRKGWLVLRGKSASDWTKHWVVLAGLSLKLYKDVWAEDSAEPLLSIDLNECENVYPSASAKNYGIEIKCRRTRYVLSAMTPGIRDSWITALQQNLHNPSPTYAEACPSDAASLPESDLVSLLPRKKHIAYVAPESHHSNSMMDDESCTDDELNSLDRPSRTQQTSLSERSFESSDDDNEVDTDRRHSLQRRRSGRDQSLSPTFRRSPVSRIKDKSTNRQQNGTMRNGSSSSLSSAVLPTVQSQRCNASRSVPREQGGSLQMRLRTLESQTQGLSHLRRSLTAAEEDVIRKREEMESLQKQLATPTREINQQCEIRYKQIVEQFMNLLKIQVGALSRFVHSQAGSLEYAELRQCIDQLIRRVAGLDEVTQMDNKINLIEGTLNNVSEAYEQISKMLITTQHETQEKEVYTEYPSSEEIADEVQDLENELEEIQSLNDHSLSTMKKTHEEMLSEQRRQYEEQIVALREEHAAELQEEKKATRMALDAVQRAHDAELRNINEKIRNIGGNSSNSIILAQASISAESRTDVQYTKQSKMLEEMSTELAQLSALYSAKCLENSQLDEKMSLLLADKENQSSLNDVEAQNRRLHRELRQKDMIIEELRQTVAILERRDVGFTDEEFPTKFDRDEIISGLLYTTYIDLLTSLFKAFLAAKLPKRQNRGTLRRRIAITRESVTSQARQIHSPTFQQQQITLNFPSLNNNNNIKTQPTAIVSSTWHPLSDVRFHSNPAIPVSEMTADYSVSELRRSMIIPVSERRKFFETIAEYSHPF
ncbi:Myosin phosphatase Rho-interacting protein [Dirofilaria immitis]|nr:Myosin phosphatase Rho-interacting protein [Dirofilaria immitis]